MIDFFRKVIEASHTARIAQLRAFEVEELERMRRASLALETTRQAERIQTLTTHSSPVYR